MFVGEYAGLPVSLTTVAQSPLRNPLPSRFVSVTSWYAAAGTAASASFWSVSDSSPRLCTGFETKTEPTPVDEPEPGFAANAAPTRIAPAAIAAPNRSMLLFKRPPFR